MTRNRSVGKEVLKSSYTGGFGIGSELWLATQPVHTPSLPSAFDFYRPNSPLFNHHRRRP
jgi:hypothetical protein